MYNKRAIYNKRAMYNRYDMYEENGKCPCNNNCPTCAYEEVDVDVPATVYAYANAGDISVTCLDSSIINNVSDNCGCQFTVRQKLIVDIPLSCGAEAALGKAQYNYYMPYLNNSYSNNLNRLNP